jgi:hypothetical protein
MGMRRRNCNTLSYSFINSSTMAFVRAQPYKRCSIGHSASISDDDYKGLSLISSLMSVDSSISPARLLGEATIFRILLVRYLTR